MIEKSPGAVGAAATGGTAAIAATTNAAKESIPFLELPLAYFTVGDQLVVLPVQNVIVLLTAFSSIVAVCYSIYKTARGKRKEA